MGAVLDLNRSLDQELQALLRGASLECLVCGEFVMRLESGVIACPECRSLLVDGTDVPAIVVPGVAVPGVASYPQ